MQRVAVVRTAGLKRRTSDRTGHSMGPTSHWLWLRVWRYGSWLHCPDKLACAGAHFANISSALELTRQRWRNDCSHASLRPRTHLINTLEPSRDQDSRDMIRRVLWPWRFDGQAEPERQTVRDGVLVTAEPGFYEPGRSPSLLLANWSWLRHIIRALRPGGH